MQGRKPISEVDYIINKLRNSWATLKMNPIVLKDVALSPEVFAAHRDSLANTLQIALFLSPQERRSLQVINIIRDKDPKAFTDYIYATEQQYLALLTDGRTIAQALGISDMVYINWDKRTQTVAVVPARSAEYKPSEVRTYKQATIMKRPETPVCPVPCPTPEPVTRTEQVVTPAKGRRERPRGGVKHKASAIPPMPSILQDQVLQAIAAPQELPAVVTERLTTSWTA